MKTERILKPMNSYLALVLIIILSVIVVYGFGTRNLVLAFSLLPFLILIVAGLIIVTPNSSKVLLLFGEYKGSVK